MEASDVDFVDVVEPRCCSGDLAGGRGSQIPGANHCVLQREEEKQEEKAAAVDTVCVTQHDGDAGRQTAFDSQSHVQKMSVFGIKPTVDLTVWSEN